MAYHSVLKLVFLNHSRTAQYLKPEVSAVSLARRIIGRGNLKRIVSAFRYRIPDICPLHRHLHLIKRSAAGHGVSRRNIQFHGFSCISVILNVRGKIIFRSLKLMDIQPGTALLPCAKRRIIGRCRADRSCPNDGKHSDGQTDYKTDSRPLSQLSFHAIPPSAAGAASS